MVRIGHCILCLMNVLLLDAARLAAAEPARQEQRIAMLVRQLGHEDCRMREAASKELALVGIDAKSALQQALEDPDLEIRVRASALLSTVMTDDFKRRLKEFEDDVEDKKKLDLPYWKQFQKALGSDSTARKMFTSMNRVEGPLLHEASKGPARAVEALTKRLEQIQNLQNLNAYVPTGSRQLTFEQIATLLLISTDPEVKVDTAIANSVSRYIYQSTFTQSLSNNDRGPMAKKLFARWLSHPIAQQSVGVSSQVLHLAMTHNMKEALPIALYVLKQPTNAYYKQTAMMAIAKLGGTEQILQIQPYLEDQTQCGNLHVAKVSPPPPIQLRDMALAVTIHLSGQNPKEFGFEYMQKQDITVFQSHTVGFADEKSRTAAFEKWAAASKAAKP